MAQLVAYFSRADENYMNGTLRYLTVGNTEVAADIIRQATGADLFKIDPVAAYAPDYSTCIEEAKQDKKRDARPELKEYLPNLDGYDTVYLGFPNYWGTMPMAVFTFLERYDFSGKTIVPFCTHEGSRLGRSVKDFTRLAPKSTILEGFEIRGGRANQAN